MKNNFPLIGICLFFASACGIIVEEVDLDPLYKNASLLAKAYKRIADSVHLDKAKYHDPFESFLLNKRVNPNYTDTDLFYISKYITKLYSRDFYGFLSDNEQITLHLTMRQMPSSYRNALLAPYVCLSAYKYNGEFLLVISDDRKSVVRAVTIEPSYRHYLKRSQKWILTNLRDEDNPENSVGLSNDAFQEHYHSSYLYDPEEDDAEKNEPLLFIGLIAPRPTTTAWILEPRGNAFAIQNAITKQYLCAGLSGDWFQRTNYHYAFIMDEESKEFQWQRCLWAVTNCTTVPSKFF